MSSGRTWETDLHVAVEMLWESASAAVWGLERNSRNLQKLNGRMKYLRSVFLGGNSHFSTYAKYSTPAAHSPRISLFYSEVCTVR